MDQGRAPSTPFKLLAILLLCWVSWCPTFAQDPVYFKLGEREFNGVQVYDVIQDQQLRYWIATSEGIHTYDFQGFERVEVQGAKSESVFSFVMRDDGVLFCHNLSNQIFSIGPDGCKVFYELAAEDAGADMSLAVAKDGNLVVTGRQVIVLDSTGKEIHRTSLHLRYLGPSSFGANGEVMVHMGLSDTLICYDKGQLIYRRLKLPAALQRRPMALKFYWLKGRHCAIDRTTGEQFFSRENGPSMELVQSGATVGIGPSVRFYVTGNELWVAGSQPGVSLADGPELQLRPLFKDYFISDVYQDMEGNYLLSTFDKGILIVPNLKAEGPLPSFRQDPVTALYRDNRLGMVMGTSQGNLAQLQEGEIKPLSQQGTHPVQGIYGHPESELLIFSDGKIRALHRSTGKLMTVMDLSLKDASWVDGKRFFLGTNLGVFQCEWLDGGEFVITNVVDLKQRVFCMEWLPAENCLYVSTAAGLFRMDQSGKPTAVKVGDEEVYATHLVIHDDKVLASTRHHGLLVIEDGKVQARLNPVVNGKQQKIQKIRFHDGYAFASCGKGLYQFDLQGRCLQSLHLSGGFPSSKIEDFEVMDGQLWVSHTDGFQRMDLGALPPRQIPPPIRLDAVRVNDLPRDLSNGARLGSHERKIEFLFSSPTLREQGGIRFHRQLVGYEQDFQPLEIGQDRVTYNALGPGTYTFLVKADRQGVMSNPVSYSFTIARPFYASAWFFTLCGLVFVGMVYLIYRWQLGVQRRKSAQLNELNASRLSAIQSQMNPHFIFNSLNSIQDLILKGDVEHSYSYITTFSNLVRRTLQYSEHDFIEFEQEVELLELYLSLEQLRFKKELRCSIEGVDEIEGIEIPPMLIQPFVENALVHGLLHKGGEKRLVIRFKLTDVLLCVVEDNGVGRSQAKAIRERQRGDHESFAGKAIRKRLEILSDVHEGGFGYEYEDLLDGGKPAGTRVTLRIPVRNKF